VLLLINAYYNTQDTARSMYTSTKMVGVLGGVVVLVLLVLVKVLLSDRNYYRCRFHEERLTEETETRG